MKPIHQTLFGNKVGNCFAACLASLVEVSIDDVPNFCAVPEDEDWIAPLITWLEERGLAHVFVKVHPGTFVFWPPASTVQAIISGPSPRGDFSHSVVGRFHRGQSGYELVHDPHPSGEGLAGEPTDVMFLLALHPERVAV